MTSGTSQGQGLVGPRLADPVPAGWGLVDQGEVSPGTGRSGTGRLGTGRPVTGRLP